MRPKDVKRAAALEKALVKFDSNNRVLPGIQNAQMRGVLVQQMIDSLRRVEFAHFVRDEKFDDGRADPSKDIFDPVRAAVYHIRSREFDEAFWLIFLSVHCGKHAKDGWKLIRELYGALGGTPWTWARVSANPRVFRAWLAKNRKNLTGRFSNHRKYESLNADADTGTGAAIESYVNWVKPPRTHQELLQDVQKVVGQDGRAVFDHLYKSMDEVKRFGRLAKFDFLTMLGKLGLAPIEPGSAYLSGATGPLRGARLLFGGRANANLSAKVLDQLLVDLDDVLKVGMQVLEDSICNWQKSPRRFISFRG